MVGGSWGSVGREEANINAVCLQKTVHWSGDLPLEIIHDDHVRCVASSGLANLVDVRYNDLLYVLIMVVSLDQCFGECVISHSGGNSNREWHHAVFPW